MSRCSSEPLSTVDLTGPPCGESQRAPTMGWGQPEGEEGPAHGYPISSAAEAEVRSDTELEGSAWKRTFYVPNLAVRPLHCAEENDP